MTREQMVRAARARAVMAGTWAVAGVAVAAIAIPLTDGSSAGTVMGVLAGTVAVGVLVAVGLVPVNLGLARRPERPEGGGAADLLTLGAGVAAVAAFVLSLALARPYDVVVIPLLATAAVLFSLLLLVCLATRYAARRPHVASGQSERGSIEE